MSTKASVVIPRPTNGPLHINAHRFEDDDHKKVYLLGAIICCGDAKEQGWPLVDEASLDLFASFGANYTHIRLGPNSAKLSSPDRDHTGYLKVSDTKLDLSKWDPAYWARVRACVEACRVRGIFCEVSLIDVWCFKHKVEVCAWDKDANTQHYDLGGVGQVAVAPAPRHKAWIRKIVDELGAFDNILWQDGNEVFDAHQDARAWVTGIHKTVRDRETEKHFRHHPFGTNAQIPELAISLQNCYEIFHSNEAVHSHGRPLIVNEHNLGSPELWNTQALSALHQESSFMCWRGGMSKTGFLKALGYMRAVRERVGY